MSVSVNDDVRNICDNFACIDTCLACYKEFAIRESEITYPQKVCFKPKEDVCNIGFKKYKPPQESYTGYIHPRQHAHHRDIC